MWSHSAFGLNNHGRRSHEQARFSPLVQVLRDNMVATGAKEMEIDVIAQVMNPYWTTCHFSLPAFNISMSYIDKIHKWLGCFNNEITIILRQQSVFSDVCIRTLKA